MKLKNIFLYGGKDKSVYEALKKVINQSNQKNLCIFAAISTVAMAIMSFLSFFLPSLEMDRTLYICTCFVCLCIYLLAKFIGNRNSNVLLVCIYFFISLFLGFGIALGTVIEPNEMTVSFIVMLFVLPLLFTDRPIRIVTFIAFGMIVYYICAFFTQNSNYILLNTYNVIPYGILSMIVSVYMVKIKVERYTLEEENKILSEIDQLTGLQNRRCYEQHLERIRKNGMTQNILVCALDVNGLKSVNDTLGHRAGDELLRGAASCILSTFQAYGKCYRTGGDEFMVILEGPAPSAKELQRYLENQTSCWKGNLVSGISLSLGFADKENGHTIDELVNAADQAMYQFKANYYRRTGNDRRRR